MCNDKLHRTPNLTGLRHIGEEVRIRYSAVALAEIEELVFLLRGNVDTALNDGIVDLTIRSYRGSL